MGDTVTIEVNENWQEFFSIIGETFTFSNQGPSEVYVRESVNAPDVQDKGFIFMPSRGGAGSMESSPFWVRTKSGDSIFHFGIVDVGAGGGGIGSGAFPVVVFTGTAKNLVVADNLKFFVMDNAANQTITIPDNASEPLPIGAEMEFLRENATGAVTFVVSGAAVLQSRDGLVTINAQYSAVSLKKIDTDEWRLMGDLA